MVIASFLSGFCRRFVEAQERRARREIAQNRHLLSRDVQVFGDELIERDENALPSSR